MKNVAIAGGGVGGMVSALLLAKKGFNVTLYEKESTLGGRLAYMEHEGYKVDKGPTIVLLPEMLQQIMEEAGISSDQYELIRCDPLYTIHFPDGKHYTKYTDMNKQLDEIERVFPEDKENFQRFMRDMLIRFNEGKPRFLEQSFLNRWEAIQPSTLNSLRKLKAFRSVKKQLDSYFINDQMKIAYALQTLYIGGNPYRTPAIYSLVSFSEHQHGIYYVKGGYASLINVFEKALIKSGVSVHKNTSIDEIKVTDNQIESIKVGKHWTDTDALVLNGDFPVAESFITKSKRSYQPSSGCVLLYMGINGIYEDKRVHQFYMGEDFGQNMKQLFKDKIVPTDPSYYVFNPSIIDTSLAPTGKSVIYVLIPVPSGESIDWEKEKNGLAEKVINTMVANGYTDIRERTEWMKIRTPKEAAMDGLFSGGSFGIAPNLFQSGPFRPQFKPNADISNLYAVGASIHPGGGIPIVMQGAKLLADGMEKKYLTRDVIRNESIKSL